MFLKKLNNLLYLKKKHFAIHIDLRHPSIKVSCILYYNSVGGKSLGKTSSEREPWTNSCLILVSFHAKASIFLPDAAELSTKY